MTWLRIDDKSAFHAKILAAGNAAWGALVRMGAWSQDRGTDGLIPEWVARSIATDSELEALMRKVITHPGKPASCLLEKVNGAYQIHDFLDWNPSAAEVRQLSKKRAKAGSNGGRKSSANRRASAQGQHRATSQAPPRATPEARAQAAPEQPLDQGFEQVAEQTATKIRPHSQIQIPDPPPTNLQDQDGLATGISRARAGILQGIPENRDPDIEARRVASLDALAALASDPSFASGGPRR